MKRLMAQKASNHPTRRRSERAIPFVQPKPQGISAAQTFDFQPTEVPGDHFVGDHVLWHISPTQACEKHDALCRQVTDAPGVAGIDCKIMACRHIAAVAQNEVDVVKKKSMWKSLRVVFILNYG